MADDDTNLDLETAEGLVIAAGKPELAKALRFHADGVRNLVQGEWGKSFIKSLDTLLAKHVAPLVAAQQETIAAVGEVGARLGKIESELGDMGEALAATIGELSNVKETQADHGERIAAHTALITDHGERLTSVELRLTSVEAEQQSLRSLMARLRRDVDVLRQLREGPGGAT